MTRAAKQAPSCICTLDILFTFLLGDPAMGLAVRGLAGKRSAVLLANHGPVVAGRDIEATVYAMEELEKVPKSQ